MELDEEEVRKWTPEEIGLYATEALIVGIIGILNYILEGVQLLRSIVIQKKMEMEWDNRSYHEMRSFGESVRSNIEVLHFTLTTFASTTMFVLEQMESGSKGVKAVRSVENRYEEARTSIEKFVDEKSDYLGSVSEEEN